ncbi:MAG TPA: hypothetical protein VMV94_10845, partial [Phycisphaerae bacterium]|nr:hypothetical protein [Phycisphaerae bacterium]
ELLAAAAVSALAATGGATLVFAIANASQETRDIRDTVSAGHYALNQIGETVRESRAIGQVQSAGVTLWVRDANADDHMTLNEVAVIRYDSSAKQILYQYTNAASAASTAVTYTNFTSYTTLQAQISASSLQSVVWASDVQSVSLSGYPSLTNTRTVDVRFAIGTGADQVAFQVAASPKAPGDYLFLADTRIAPSGTQSRVRRKYYSIWDGFAAYPTVTINQVYTSP